MAEMASQSKAGGRGTTSTSVTVTTQQTTPRSRGIALNKAFLTSISGILSIVSVVLTFVAMVCVTASLPARRNDPSFEFHESTTIISFTFLLIFTIVALLHLYTLLSIRSIVMKFIMLGYSAVLALFLLISSAVLLDYVVRNGGLISNHNDIASSLNEHHLIYDLDGLRASGAFGLLGSFTLLGITVVLVLDVLGIRKEGEIF